MPHLGVNRGWGASRTQGSGTEQFRVVRSVARAYARVIEHRHRPAIDRWERVADEISIHRAQDRQLVAIRNCRRNFRVRE